MEGASAEPGRGRPQDRAGRGNGLRSLLGKSLEIFTREVKLSVCALGLGQVDYSGSCVRNRWWGRSINRIVASYYNNDEGEKVLWLEGSVHGTKGHIIFQKLGKLGYLIGCI